MNQITNDRPDSELRDQHRTSLLAAIVDSSQDAIISKTLDSIVTSWNGGAERLFGYSAQEMIGHSITIIIPPERLGEEDFILSQIRRGGRIEHFETVRRHKDGRSIDISLTISPIRSDTGELIGASKIARDIGEQKETEGRIRMLLREVNHRVKNQFAVILSMIRETTKRAVSPEQFERQVRERVMALSRSHDLLVHADWRGATVREVLATQLEPFGDNGRLTSEGPPIMLQPKAVQYLGMAFHELAANSARHGALSVPEGRIHVAWAHGTSPEPRFTLHWRESGGASSGRPGEGGFGTVVAQRVTPLALHGNGSLSITPQGVDWTLDAPMAFVEAGFELERLSG